MTYLLRSHLGRATLTAVLLTACGPDKGDTDGGETATTGEPATDTATSDAPTTGEPTTSAATSGVTTTDPTTTTDSTTTDAMTTGQAPDACVDGVAETGIVVEFGVPELPCEMEVCESHREAACTVSEINVEGPTRVTLACEYPNTGPAVDVIVVDPVPGGTLDLAVGGAVELTYDSWSAFEGGGSGQLRLTDERGLVLASGTTARFGGAAGDTGWAVDWLGELVAPLTADIASQGCPDDATRSAITITRDATSVVVTAGRSALLTAGDSWLIIARVASIAPDSVIDGRIGVEVVRVLP